MGAGNGIGWIDAPVSGGPEAAATGSLAIMAGGSEADMALAEPALRDLAGVLTHMGAVGSGQVTKMVLQHLARGLKAPSPMTRQSVELFWILVAKGHGETDGTAILKLFDASEDI